MYMLDIKSKLVLKILLKECPNGSYNIVEAKDIISSMPIKYRVDNDGLNNILIYLERQEYISINYDDEGVYCLCVLPYGNEVLELEKDKKSEDRKYPRLWLLFLISLLASLLGCLASQYLILLLTG